MIENGVDLEQKHPAPTVKLDLKNYPSARALISTIELSKSMKIVSETKDYMLVELIPQKILFKDITKRQSLYKCLSSKPIMVENRMIECIRPLWNRNHKRFTMASYIAKMVGIPLHFLSRRHSIDGIVNISGIFLNK